MHQLVLPLFGKWLWLLMSLEKGFLWEMGADWNSNSCYLKDADQRWECCTRGNITVRKIAKERDKGMLNEFYQFLSSFI